MQIRSKENFHDYCFCGINDELRTLSNLVGTRPSAFKSTMILPRPTLASTWRDNDHFTKSSPTVGLSANVSHEFSNWHFANSDASNFSNVSHNRALPSRFCANRLNKDFHLKMEVSNTFSPNLANSNNIVIKPEIMKTKSETCKPTKIIKVLKQEASAKSEATRDANLKFSKAETTTYATLGPSSKSVLSSINPSDFVLEKVIKRDDVFQVNKLSKTSRLSERADVINKTILRKLKKFVDVSFRSYFDYMKKRRNITDKINAHMFITAKTYVTKEFELTDDEYIYLVALLDLKEKYHHDNNQFSLFRNKIHKLIKAYNRDLESDVLSIPQFAKLVYACLSKDGFTSQILVRANDDELKAKYSLQIDELKRTCLESIQKASE